LNSTPPGEDRDAELLRLIARGDPLAAREMVARKLPRQLALATRMLGDASEAEDVAQESLLRLWRQAPSWKQGTARFDTWLHRVALNLCHDRLRRTRRVAVTEDVPERADGEPLPDAVLVAEGESERVALALQALPLRQREAIVLQYYQELSNGEAAMVMEVSVEALESLLVRARRRLRVLLADDADDA
jgi:RNA polymerase sigma-70 factor (ECF subfamily)